MILGRYGTSGPVSGLRKQNAIVGYAQEGNYMSTILYLQRPKWIKDDDVWQKICDSVRLDLPQGMEIK